MKLGLWNGIKEQLSLGVGMGGGVWTPLMPTSDGGVLPHTFLNMQELYQDEAKTTPAVSDGDVVGSYVNKGTDVYDLIKQVSGDKPTLKLNILNGRSMLLWDGVNDYLIGTFSGGLLSLPFTIFSFSQLDASVVNDNTNRTLFYGDDATNYVSMFQRASQIPDQFAMNAGANLNIEVSNSNWNLFTILVNGASSQVWIDGVSKVSGNIGANSLDGLSYGFGFAGWKGYTGIFTIYPGNISVADKNQVGTYISNYYGRGWTTIT